MGRDAVTRAPFPHTLHARHYGCHRLPQRLRALRQEGPRAQEGRQGQEGPSVRLAASAPGNIGPNRTLWDGWESNPESPAYLDGTLPGDAGFDPLGLSKPVEYLQFELDELDGSAAVNKIGGVIGKLKKVDNTPTERTIVVSV